MTNVQSFYSTLPFGFSRGITKGKTNKNARLFYFIFFFLSGGGEGGEKPKENASNKDKVSEREMSLETYY